MADMGMLSFQTPEEVAIARKAAEDARNMQMSQMGLGQSARYGMLSAGSALGNAIGAATGYVDPNEARAQKTQQVMSSPDSDLNTSKGMLAKAAELRTIDPRLSMQLLLKGRELEKQEQAAVLAGRKQDTLDAAQLSLTKLQAAQAEKALQENPNLTSVEVGVKDKPGWMQKILFDKTGKEESIPIGEPYQTAQAMKISVGGSGGGESKQPITYVDDKGNAVWGTIAEARGKAAAVYDPNTRALVTGAQTGGKTGVEMSAKNYGVARGAVAAIPKVDALISQLEKGDVITGSASDIRTGFAKMTSLLGGKDAAKKASDTEIAEAMMGSEVFPLIQSLGIGAKGMDTPAEREFIRSVLTGSKSMEKETLLQLARMRKAELQKGIERWNSEVDTGQNDIFFKSTGIPKSRFGVSTVTPKPADKFVTGKQYKDAKGNVATYLGNGQWK